MPVAPLTIVPVDDMRYAGQLLDYVRIKHRSAVDFSGLPILLQLKTASWQTCLEKLRQAFDQQHDIVQDSGTLPDMSDWSRYLNEQKQCHLLVLRLLDPNSVELLCKLIQWGMSEKRSTSSIYAIVAVDNKLLEHTLVKQSMQVAGKKVDTYIHDGSHDGPPSKSSWGLWWVAGILLIAAMGVWFWSGGFEQSGPDTVASSTSPVVASPVQGTELETDQPLPGDTGKAEIWDYRVESDWLKQLAEIEPSPQQDDSIVIEPDQGVAEPATIDSQINTAEENAVVRQVQETTIDDEQLIAAFQSALRSNDLQWLEINAQSLLNRSVVDDEPVLMILTEGNYIQWVDTLLEQGAEPDVTNVRNWTPLLASAVYGRLEIAQALLDAGANPNQSTIEGRSALMAAVHNRHTNVAELLLQYGADTNHQSNDGWSPLFYAAWNGDAQLVEMLLAAGARQDLVSATGMSVMDIAQQRNNQQIIDLLNS